MFSHTSLENQEFDFAVVDGCSGCLPFTSVLSAFFIVNVAGLLLSSIAEICNNKI